MLLQFDRISTNYKLLRVDGCSTTIYLQSVEDLPNGGWWIEKAFWKVPRGVLAARTTPDWTHSIVQAHLVPHRVSRAKRPRNERESREPLCVSCAKPRETSAKRARNAVKHPVKTT